MHPYFRIGFTVAIIPTRTDLALLVQCVVSNVTNYTLVKVTWLRGDKVVESDSRTDMIVLPLFANYTSASFLLRIQQLTYLDAGNYTCIVHLPSKKLKYRSTVVQRKNS